VIDYNAIADGFRKLIKKGERDLERAKKRHGIAIIRRMAGPSDAVDLLVESTLGEVRSAYMTLEEAHMGLASIPVCKKYVEAGNPASDPDIADLF
jgi:hypothetical protein